MYIHFYAKHFKQPVFLPTIKIPACPRGLCLISAGDALAVSLESIKGLARTGAKTLRFCSARSTYFQPLILPFFGVLNISVKRLPKKSQGELNYNMSDSHEETVISWKFLS